MIHVAERQERMKRRIDGGRHCVVVERAGRIERHHLVFMRLAAVHRDELLQPVQIQQRESGVANAAEIAAAAFHRHHGRRAAGERIRGVVFRAGVSAAEIGDAKIGSQQVRSVAEQIQIAHTACDFFVPVAFDQAAAVACAVSLMCVFLSGVSGYDLRPPRAAFVRDSIGVAAGAEGCQRIGIEARAHAANRQSRDRHRHGRHASASLRRR